MKAPSPHDFRKPPLPPALRGLLALWGPQTAAQTARLWAGQLPFQAEVEFLGGELAVAREALSTLPEATLFFAAALGGGPEASVLAVARPLAQAVLAGVLGSPVEAENLDQELTPVEEEMAEFVAEQFFLGPLQRTWPLAEKLRLGAPRRGPTASEAPFAPTALVLAVRFRVKAPFGEFDWCWLAPRDAGLLASLQGGASSQAPAADEREALVRDLPVRLTVRLGTAALSLLNLAGLREGDLLLLDQPIDRPLPALLGGQVKFLVWPGARGARQAVSIRTTVESES
jgi:flagellar motor switch protein FliM